MGCIVRLYQRPGNGVVGNRIAGEQNNAMTKMHLIHTQRAGECTENRGTKLRTVKLSNGVFQAVAQKFG